MRFDGKVALVTGAGSGIGRATALAFARNGAKVAALDVRADAVADTVAIIDSSGGRAVSLTCDLSIPAQIELAVEHTVSAFGRLDVAFNNAGIGLGKGIVGTTEDEWDSTHDLNLKGVWLCMKYEIPEMLKVGGGAIVNTSSITAWRYFAGNNPAYVSSKSGQLQLTKYAALEYAAQGIRVNSVLPGITNTSLALDGSEANLQQMVEKYHPMKRIGLPEDIANAVLFLCSSEASMITGVDLPVDGGWSAK